MFFQCTLVSEAIFLLCPMCPLCPSLSAQPSSAAGLRGTAPTYTSADSTGDIVSVLEYPQAQVHQSEPLIWCRHYSIRLLNFKDNQLKMSKQNKLNSAGKGGWRITRFFFCWKNCLCKDLPLEWIRRVWVSAWRKRPEWLPIATSWKKCYFMTNYIKPRWQKLPEILLFYFHTLSETEHAGRMNVPHVQTLC